MSTYAAPIYSKLWRFRRHNSGVRLPDPELRKFINLMLKDPFPFNINIFDTNDQTGGTLGLPLGALMSAEGRFTCTEDFWWYGLTASFTAGSATDPANPPFAFQLFHTTNVGQQDQAGLLHQQKPVTHNLFLGTAQHPMYLKSPKLFRQNTEVMCGVQNLQAVNNTIQVMMLGYIGEPAGGLT
jgi:hypothetical protein